MAMMQVEVPTTFTTSPSRQPAPIASQCASNAPTGMGIPARRPSFSAHSGAQMPGEMVRSADTRPPSLSRMPSNSGSSFDRNVLRRQPAPLRVPHPLVAHGADAALHRFGIGDAAQRGRHHVAVLERRGKLCRASPDCAAASAAAWQIPTRANRRRRTSRSPPAFSACASSVICCASFLARWSHHR